MNLNYNLTHIVTTVLERMLKDVPKSELFQPLRDNPNLTINDLSEGRIDAMIRNYINTPDTILAEPAFQHKFIEQFIKQYQDYNDRSASLGRNDHILTPANKEGEHDAHIAMHQVAHLISHELEHTTLDHIITTRSATYSPTQIAQLKSALKENKLLLVKGKSGKFDTLVVASQISNALDSPSYASNFLSQLDGKIETFAEIPLQNSPNYNAEVTPVVIKQGSQAISNELHNAQSQLLLKKATAQLAFLQSNGIALSKQMLVNYQTQNFSAEMLDRAGQKILVRSKLNEPKPSYNIIFLEGDYAGQMMTLSPEQIRDYHQQKLSATDIFRQLQKIAAAEKAEEQLARLGQIKDRNSNLAQGAATVANAEEAEARLNEDKDKTINLFNKTNYPNDFKIKETTTTSVTLHIPTLNNESAARRAKLIRRHLAEGKRITGSLQIKKAREAREQSTKSRRQPHQINQKKPAPAKPQDPNKKSPLTKQPKRNNTAMKWLAGLGGGTAVATPSIFSFLDILNII